jgi:hypothetical protein
VGNFNGDGKPDLAVVNERSDTVSVLLNTTPTGATTPSFAPQRSFATGHYPSSVAVGDFNGDGKPDLAVVKLNSDEVSEVSVLLNTTPTGATTPSFAPRQTFAAPSSQSVVVGDFNGDGRPDLAITDGNAVSVLLNTTPAGATTPSFAPQQTFAAGGFARSVGAGDFSSDGKPDLAAINYGSNTVSLLLNTTATGATMPSFAAPRTFLTGSHPDAVAVGDFNGDGQPDLAIANYRSDTVSVLLNDAAPVRVSGSPATGTISSAPEAPTAIAVIPGTTPQSAVVGTTFAVPLAVEVRDAAGNLVQGVSVTFDAPRRGPGGTFNGHPAVAVLTDATGRATAPPLLADTRAGRYRVKAEANGGNVPSTSFHLTNIAAAANHFAITTDAADPDIPGTPFDVTVYAVDAYGNVDSNYRGTVTWTTTDPDPGVQLPADYTFQPGDQGMVTFAGGVTLITPGEQVITAMDTADPTITGSATVTVSSAGPDVRRQLPSRSVQAGLEAASADRLFADLWQAELGSLGSPNHDRRAAARPWGLGWLWEQDL